MPLPTYLMSNFPSVRPSLNLQFDSQPTPEDMTSHLASVGATFSRASTGTYTDANGLIAEASAGQARPNYSNAGVHEGLLIEGGGTNLVQGSENSDDTTRWRHNRVTVVEEAIINPKGTARAFKVSETTDNQSHTLVIEVAYFPTVTNGVKYTQSYFVKKGDGANAPDIIQIASGTDLGSKFQNYNISTGALLSGNGDGATIEDYGNGWYRISFTATATQTDTSAFLLAFTNNANASRLTSYAGQTDADIYVWGAQMEQGSFPTSYIPTIPTFSSRASTATFFNSSGVLSTASTNVARTDHKYIDGEWVEAGLLLEAESINRITRSEEFQHWNHPNITVTTNATTAPDGTTTADLLDGEGTPAANRVTKPYTHSTSGVDFTFSVFIKANEVDTGGLLIYDGSTFASCTFDLTAETITQSVGENSGIENVGNGWYRLYVSGTNTGTNNVTPMIYLEDLSSSTTVPSGDGFYVWGGQLEKDTLQPTSYIPTTTAEVTRSEDVYTTATKTRSADVCYIDGAAFTDFYNQEQGTWFFNAKFLTTGETNKFITPVGDTGSKIVYEKNSSNNFLFISIVDGTESDRITAGTITSNQSYKTALVLQDDACKIFIDGSLVDSSTSITIPKNLNKVWMFRDDSDRRYLNGTCAKMIYFPRALTPDTQLEKLTQ